MVGRASQSPLSDGAIGLSDVIGIGAAFDGLEAGALFQMIAECGRVNLVRFGALCGVGEHLLCLIADDALIFSGLIEAFQIAMW